MSLELFCNGLLSALVTGGYQGLLLTAVAALGLKLVPRTNAATRHAVWFAVLLVVAALPVAHLFWSPGPPAPTGADLGAIAGKVGETVPASPAADVTAAGTSQPESRSEKLALDSGTGFQPVHPRASSPRFQWSSTRAGSPSADRQDACPTSSASLSPPLIR